MTIYTFEREFGRELIEVFNPGDKIDLTAFHVSSFQSLQYFLEYTGNNDSTYINLGFNNIDESIMVYDKLLTASDFIFDTSISPVVNSSTDGWDVLFGAFGDDLLSGGGGVDALVGGAGNDTLIGGIDADTMRGESGDDFYYVDDFFDVVEEAVGHGKDRVAASTSWRLTDGAEVEWLSTNSSKGFAAINLRGNEFGQIVGGNAAANVLNGRGGDDVLYGYDGDDTLIGGKGADALHGGKGINAASYGGDVTAGVTVSLADPSINTGNAAGDTFEDIADVYGSAFDDHLIGDLHANLLIGGAGNDILEGGAGGDTLQGDGDLDTVSYVGSTGGVVASLANPSVNKGDAAGDTYSSIENLIGSNFDDLLTGTSGANVINGGKGYDVIKGGNGNDTLTGWAGRDTFVFNSALGASNVDTITDFNSAADTMQLDDAVFTGLGSGVLVAGAFKNIADGPKDADDRILYNSATGILYFDADGSGSAYGNVKFANLANHVVLTAADFIVI
jgi:serralysin